MPAISKMALAGSASVACYLAAAPLFAQPGGPLGPHILPMSGASTSGDVAACTDTLGTMPMACAGAAALVSAGLVSTRVRNKKVARASLGGGTPGSPPLAPFNPATQVGATAPLGFFDPAGFAKPGDKEGFRNLRAAELKHGRVAMMAALGAVVQHSIKFPGFESVPSGLAAVTTPPGAYGFVALFLISGVLELAVWTQDPNKEVGDFGDPVGFNMYNEDMRNKEINNGRFAMFAALGIIAAETLTGKDAVQQFM